jgi:hypothetical protein
MLIWQLTVRRPTADLNVAQNAIYLENNANNGLVGPLTPGSSSSISNSQCTLNGSGTTVTKSGNNLTVNWNITFTGSFIGTAEKTYLADYNASANSGFVQEGTWTP